MKSFVDLTDTDIEQIKQYYPTTKLRVLARNLGSTEQAIKSAIRKFGLQKQQLYNPGPWTREEDEKLVLLWNQGLLVRDIADQVGRTTHATNARKAKLVRDGVITNRTKPYIRSELIEWSDSELDYLRENYGKIKTKLIAEKLGRTPTAVKTYAKYLRDTNGEDLHADDTYVNFSRYEYNQNFFGDLTPESAYVAGILVADGFISHDLKDFRLTLNDKEIVDLVASSVGVDLPVKSESVRGNRQPSYRVYCGSKKLYQDLVAIYNIPPEESKTFGYTHPENLPDELVMPFIVGLIDGDGGVYSPPAGGFVLHLCGTEVMLNWVKGHLDGLYGRATGGIHKHGSIHRLSYSGASARTIHQKLRELPIWKLPRKWDIEY